MGFGFGSLLKGLDSKIRFWYDVLGGEQTLDVAFSELFSIACFKHASVEMEYQFYYSGRIGR